MGPSPCVDVVLATYRRPHTLAYAIRSVLEQGHAALRLHVVGDGCDEASERIVRAIDDPRVAFRRFPKGRGFGYAHRNVVLRETRAPFVAYMTDDDLWFPDHLERALRELEEGALDLVALRSVAVQYPDTLDPHFFAFDWAGPFATRFLRTWFMGAVNCVHRRAVFERVGYWNDRLFRFGDREFYNRVRLSGPATRYVDHVSLVRFYARHWDARYRPDVAPPQERYLDKVRDPAWRDAVRALAVRPGREPRVRLRQWRDFAGFAAHSGPKFVRFLWERARNGAPEARLC